MDYQKIYSQLILKAKERKTVEGYKELHHIIPKCVKGTDDINNLVELTAKEHFIAHLLLTEIYPKSQKIKYALWMMASMEAPNQNRYKVSANMYRIIKEQIAKKSIEHKAKKGMVGTNKGIPMSEEQKRKISETLKNRNKNGIKKN